MDCRDFRKKHVGYVDDLLSAREMDAMQRHLLTCAKCSRQDIMVRRSLMLVRSLPSIEPSADFLHRLNARIEQLGPAARVDVVDCSCMYARNSFCTSSGFSSPLATRVSSSL